MFGCFKEFSIVHKCLVSETFHEEYTYTPVYANNEFSSEGFNNLVAGNGCLVASDNKGYIKIIPIVDTKHYADLGFVLTKKDRYRYSSFHLTQNDTFYTEFNQNCFMMCTKEIDPDNNRILTFAGEFLTQFCLNSQKFKSTPKKTLDYNIVAFSYNDLYAFTCCNMGEIRQYEISTMSLYHTYRSENEIGMTKIMLCTPDNSWLFTTDANGNAFQFDLHRKKLVFSYPNLNKTAITSICCTPDSKF